MFYHYNGEDYEVAYILSKDNYNLTEIVAFRGNEGISVNPFTKDVTFMDDLSYSLDDDLFKKLEADYQIYYMSMETNLGIWQQMSYLYPDEIVNTGGLQNYLDYCSNNRITRESIIDKLNLSKKAQLELPDLPTLVKENNIKRDCEMEV